ncbi:MAG: hypothetical protein ACRECF_09150 [Methyloceanibacter sp.]|jgi:hypothetical protein
MRLLLILIIIAAIFAFVQSQRHGCTWGQEGWFDCVLRGQTVSETPTPAAPEPATPAPETPAPETPNP